jgi:hypothetical protein
MDLSGYNVILAPLGVISAIATAFYSVLEVKKQIHKARKAAADEILEEAKEHTELVKVKLESKISGLENEIYNLKNNLEKDVSNLKENHAIELKNLSERVELLRTDLQTQTSQILSLLAQLVKKS